VEAMLNRLKKSSILPRMQKFACVWGSIMLSSYF